MRTEVYCVKKTFVLLFAQERYRLVLLFGRLPDCDGNGCCDGVSPFFPLLMTVHAVNPNKRIKLCYDYNTVK
ncbi:MAG: hypothetical protein PUB81_04730 [Clostridiales bacterium]|nr:hypothetical protein [Clostridiales bacterium]